MPLPQRAARVISLLLMATGGSCRSARFRQIEGVKRTFVSMVSDVIREHARKGNPPPTVAVLDVGANTGAFSLLMMQKLRDVAPSLRPHLTMFEPQPQFRKLLDGYAAQWNGVLVPAAAWKEATNLTFHINANNSESASLESSTTADAQAARMGYKWIDLTVPAVDLAEHLIRTLPSPAPDNLNSSIAFLKIDVEGAEFELLPRLVSTRALCRVRYILIEWHLRNVVAKKRAAGLAMMEGLQTVLDSSCSSLPLVVHDDMPINNYITDRGAPYDGLPPPAQRPALVQAFKTQMADAIAAQSTHDVAAPPVEARASLSRKSVVSTHTSSSVRQHHHQHEHRPLPANPQLKRHRDRDRNPRYT